MTILRRMESLNVMNCEKHLFSYLVSFVRFFFSRLIHAFPYLAIEMIESTCRLHEQNAFFVH